MPQLHPSRYKYLQHTDVENPLHKADHYRAAGFLHYCDEWDGLLIDKSDHEFEYCRCKFSDEFDPETGKLVQ